MAFAGIFVKGTMSKKQNELWPIAPYYQLEVGEDGVHVRSFSKHAKGRLLTEKPTKDGYIRVKMKLPTGRFQYVHLAHLVAKVYLGERPEGDWTVNHKDGNKSNNWPDNLEYLTRIDNLKHAIALGLHVAAHPERHGNYKDGHALKSRRKEYQHEWYIENRERIRQQANATYPIRRDKVMAYSTARYAASQQNNPASKYYVKAQP